MYMAVQDTVLGELSKCTEQGEGCGLRSHTELLLTHHTPKNHVYGSARHRSWRVKQMHGAGRRLRIEVTHQKNHVYGSVHELLVLQEKPLKLFWYLLTVSPLQTDVQRPYTPAKDLCIHFQTRNWLPKH
jgi:hypothetical protein